MGGPGAFPMSHTIGVRYCVGGLLVMVLPFVVRRSDSFCVCDECGLVL